MKIGIVVFDNFTDIDFFMHWDLLNRVRLLNLRDHWDVKILGTSGSHLSASGLKVETTGLVEESGGCDALVFSSGLGTRELISDPKYLTRLDIRPGEQIVAAQCSGSLIVGAKTLLRDVKVSGYPPILGILKEYGAVPVNDSLVVDKGIATASSCLGSVLLSSYVIGKLAGPSVKAEVMKSICPISGFDDFSTRYLEVMG